VQPTADIFVVNKRLLFIPIQYSFHDLLSVCIAVYTFLANIPPVQKDIHSIMVYIFLVNIPPAHQAIFIPFLVNDKQIFVSV